MMTPHDFDVFTATIRIVIVGLMLFRSLQLKMRWVSVLSILLMARLATSVLNPIVEDMVSVVSITLTVFIVNSGMLELNKLRRKGNHIVYIEKHHRNE